MKAMQRIRWGLMLCATLMLSGAAVAQTTGSIRGSVKDQSGAVVPAASVTVTLQGTATTRKAEAGADGEFSFPELAVGHYSLTVEATGFKKYEIKDVTVDLGHVAVIAAQLQLGEAAQTVTVEAEAAQVETNSTQLGAVMTDLAVRQLPLTTRDTYQLLQLQPGVQSQVGADLFYGSDQAGVVSVNGGRGRSNNYMVNGGDGNDIFVNLPAIQPSPDAIQEFRVLTNTFDAEFGRNSGSVVNVVTKSGTNVLHGDVYDFFRNTVLDARGFFDPSTPDYKQNQFGFTLGGPIKKDTTFIFGSYEGNRLRQGKSSGNVTLPTAAEQSGDFSSGPTFVGTLTNPAVFANRPGCPAAAFPAGTPYSTIFPNNQVPTQCFDPTAADLYNQFVLPFSNGSGVVSTLPDKKERGDQFTLRFDHKLNPNQQLSVYYYFDDVSQAQPFSFFQASGANLPGFGALFTTRVQQWNFSHTWTLGGSSVNEFRFNYFREGQGDLNHPQNILSSVHASCSTIPASMCFSDPNNPQFGITTALPGREGVPYINVSGGFTIGNNFNGELPQIGNTFQWADNYTTVLGKHTLKFGGDIRRQRFDQFLYFEINGDFTFMSNSNICGPSNPVLPPNCTPVGGNDVGFTDAFANYLLGLPTSYGQGSAQGENVRNTEEFLFVQDSWKLRPTVTLNYGLRWEFNSPYIDLGNRLQTFRPGQVSTQYPCVLSAPSAAALGSSTCNGAGVTPVGLVFPGDRGVPNGLTTAYYKSFAPRFGLAWSPDWSTGWLAKLTGGPGKASVRAGWGLFYNPIEQLVLEQFSAEPPFGGSTLLSNPQFNLPFQLQSQAGTGLGQPNPFMGVINQTPNTPCGPVPGGPPGCVDFSTFRPILLFGEFQPHLRSQYAVQYNLTLQREIAKDYILQFSYVGTQGHRLLASHDLNIGNAATCLALNQIPGQSCGPFGSDSQYIIPANSIPAGVTLPLPYGSVPFVTGPNNPAIDLVGLRPFSSPLCQPTTGVGCPADGVPVFSNIFAEDTIANSNYNSFQASLEKHFSKGLLFTLAYTLSKSIDQASSFENELNPVNFARSRGLSLFDAKNRIVFSPYWELPVRKMQGFAGKALDGWAVSGIITYQSGFPIRVFSANDQELASSFFFEPAGEPVITGPVQFMDPRSNPGHFLFNTGAFSNAALGSFGNAPHALCCGPALSQTDLSFQKNTPINERLHTEFRADVFNVWNHTQFLNPDGNFSNLGTTFGVVTKARDPRLLQFALKLIF